jgi:tetratricopeptide (TPR) repeat protein
MMRWLAVAAVVVWVRVHAAPSAEQLLQTGVQEFARAYQSWDGAGFEAAARLFDAALAAGPESATAFYWLGAAHFHRVLYLRNSFEPNANAAEAAMDAALAALNRAVKLDPGHAEAHALLGTLYGMRIDGNLVRGLRFGARVEKHRAAALKHGADNPRVRYLLGTCQFHTAKKPAAWWEALATLQAAEQLFAAEAQRPAGPREPRWGQASCLMFIGLTFEKLGQRERASEYLRRALALQPSNRLAREALARVEGGPKNQS